jgi:diaminopimelate decarboxylase
MNSSSIESLRFLTGAQVRDIADQFGSPLYVYDERTLKKNAEQVLSFPAPFGLTPRFAMKANPHRVILQLFHKAGLHIDASSGFEARRAIAAGIPASHISLSTQELPTDFVELLQAGVQINLCSLEQVRRVGEALPGWKVGLRVNPGLGSGGTGKTNVGGPSSSFGIWHEYLNEATALIAKHGLQLFRIHTHIGSGSDPEVWSRVALMSLDTVRRFPSVTHLNLGGGYKVARMREEVSTDLQKIGLPVAGALEAFAKETGRKIHLEIEPGTYLVANAGALLCRVQDKVNTGEKGHVFLKLNAGMTDILRPSLYGAQHPLVVVPVGPESAEHPLEAAVVVGHCCESGDLLSPAPGAAETLSERLMLKAEIGDFLVIEGSGAYVASMASHNYNSFPQSGAVLLRENGSPVLISQRQTLEDIWSRELSV